ncbi:MAG: hypothetical protein NTZ03_06790 [Actinobacteria bacterium]|nr:hypothetical protein [Actinomycetota bacterium]
MFSLAYTVNDQSIVLSALDSQGLANSIAYASTFGPLVNVAIKTY